MLNPSVRTTSRIAALLLAAAFASAARAQTIVDLGVLPGGTTTGGGSISADGSVVTGNGDIAGGSYRGWRWTAAAGKINIGVTPGSDHSYAYGLSGNGLVVIGASGASTASSYDTATRWTAATGNVSLGSITPGQPSFASDASFDGSTIIGYGYIGGGYERAWKWTSTTGMQAFGQLLPGTNHSVGLACSADGTQMTGYCFNNAPSLIWPSGCVWDAAGTVTALGTLPGSVWSVPGAMSADGRVVVGYCSDAGGGTLKAFRWTQATGIEDLGIPAGSVQAVASSLTADGGTVVGYGATAASTASFIWTRATGPIDLATFLNARGISTTGWTLDTAAISADGSAFTGSGRHNGLDRAWYVSLGCIAPSIGNQPVNQTVAAGSAFSFTVGATGSGLTYQWRKDGTLINGATAAMYSVASAAALHAGSYTCDIVGSCGSLTSAAATLTVTTGCQSPTITSQPTSRSVALGSSVSFTAGVTGTGLTYSWMKNGTTIANATSATYTINSVAQSHVGTYTCVILGSCGTATTNGAALTISGGCTAPDISSHPQAQTVCNGASVELSFVSSGSEPMSYQWRRDGVEIDGATEPTLVINAINFDDQGSYDCVLANGCGDTDTDNAQLTVQDCPPPCPADFNQDGGIDGQDVEAFFTTWESGDAAADVNADGGVDGADVETFFVVWEAGGC